FWALPEHEPQARRMWKEAPHILEVLGHYFGEYPFLKDKYWVVEAPYLGMEHQTLVAYGDNFTDNSFGFDGILLHETAHEWWGNKVTVSDWADFWLHEAFATYAEALYVDATSGHERYLAYMKRMRPRIHNKKPIVQGKNLDSIHAYTGDIYFKGAWVLHTLRWLIGDEAFLGILHDFPNDPRYAYRHATTKDFTDFVEARTGRDLGWFWKRYLYTAALPRYTVTRSASGKGEKLQLAWDDPSFELPIPVSVGGQLHRVAMPQGHGELVIPAGAEVEVDPEGLILAKGPTD
ncbi:MAG TPA: M1 family peptidase, partial [Acidobacteria bacterium]|nr:M1 family peptidase [Acidobacteriota bacterium]